MKNPPSFDRLKHLYLSCAGMDLEMLQDYIESQADLDHQDTDPETLGLCGGMTLLHYAAAAGDIKTIFLLTSAGEDPNLQSHDGWTPLHHAIDLDFVVATQERWDWPTELHRAMLHGHSVVRSLNNGMTKRSTEWFRLVV